MPLSSHPCLPCCWSRSQTAGSLRSTDITPLPRYCGPIRHPLAVPRFPGVAGYTGSLLRRFRDGARRASPVARRILVIVLSLLPRQSVPPHRSDCDVPCCLRSIIESSASEVKISRPPLRSLSLRPDDSLTIPRMALSIDFQDSVSFLLTIQATGPLTLALAGLTPTEYTSLTLDIRSCLPFRYPESSARPSETTGSPAWLEPVV